MDAKNRLLDTALDLFVRFGYQATGVQSVCELSELTKPTLYHYFSSKSGLLESLLERELAPLLSVLQETSLYKHDLTQTLWLVTDGFFKYFKHREKVALLILTFYHTPRESDTAKITAVYMDKATDILIQLFLEAEADHGNFIGRSIRYGRSFLGILFVYLRLWLDAKIIPEEKDLREMLHQFSHGIYS